MSARRLAHYRPIRTFGRRNPGLVLGTELAAPAALTLSEEVRLFALTFVGGFLFMTVYLA